LITEVLGWHGVKAVTAASHCHPERSEGPVQFRELHRSVAAKEAAQDDNASK